MRLLPLEAMASAMQIEEIEVAMGVEAPEVADTVSKDEAEAEPITPEDADKKAHASEGIEKALGLAKACKEWLRQISKHLSHVESRLMESEYEAHEMVRLVIQAIEGFRPEPCGDWGWLLRKVQDIAVRMMRQLMKIYGKAEANEAFHMRAIDLVRLYVEEAFHRVLEGIGEDNMRKGGLCSMMVTMKNIEARTLGEDSAMGIFVTFSEENVTKIVRAMLTGKANIEDMPSWAEVSYHDDLKFEAFSLKRVRVHAADVAMKKCEVQAVIEGAGGEIWGGAAVPGHESPSVFASLFWP